MKKLLLPILLPVIFLCQVTKAQSALQFDETVPNYVQVGNSMNTVLAGTNTITVEAWVYLTSYSFLPTIAGNYGTGMQFLFRVDGNRATFWVDNGGGFTNIGGATTVPLNTWTHLAGVWNGTQLKVYINGVQDGVANVSGAFNSTTNPVRIGASLESESWNGKLDDVRIWSTARTVTEINTFINGCVPPASTGLLALYNFEEGSGNTLTDRTGHGYNGTLINAPTWTTGLISCAVLSVNFESINAQKQNDQVLLNWKVAGEVDILRYEIDRSADGRNFAYAATVLASRLAEYNWRDFSPSQSLSYYRIKSVDVAGVIKYSPIAVIPTGNDQKIIVSPNPVRGNEITLQFKNQLPGIYDVRLVDIMGRSQALNAFRINNGNSTYIIQLPKGMAKGMYQLVLSDSDKKMNSLPLYITNP